MVNPYLAFLGLVVVVVLTPGADFAVVTRNTIMGNRRQGGAAALGVACGCAAQGLAAVAGLSALIAGSPSTFRVITWAGAAYLLYLGARGMISAIRGTPPAVEGSASAAKGWRQGFLSTVTNPKVLLFYLAVLPPSWPQPTPCGSRFPWR